MRDQIINEAIDWVGTPFILGAQLKGIGVDCARLPVAIALQLNLITQSQVDNIPVYDLEYHIHNEDEKLLNILEGFGCTKVDEMKPGDILAFQYGRSCSHLGILINDCQFVHAYSMMARPRVVINTLGGEFLPRLKAVYSFPGVQ